MRFDADGMVKSSQERKRLKLLTFTGETPAAALKKAQIECGEDALVLGSKEIRKKTLTQTALYEVVIALEEEGDAKRTKTPQPSKSQPQKTYARANDDVVVNMSAMAKQMSAIDRLTEASSANIESMAKKIQPQPVQAVSVIPPVSVAQESDEIRTIKSEISKLVDNVKLIQNMMWDSSEAIRDGLKIPPEFAEIYKISRDSGMSNEHLCEIMQLTLEHMPVKMRDNSNTIKRYFNVLLRKMIPVRPEFGLSAQNKRIIMFVGPTGVGKTTTLAKLAARYAFKQETKHKVGIITLDTYRIGAVEQLMHYAKIMRLSIEAVVDPSEFKTALASLRNCDYILIDTVGSSQYDREKIARINKFLRAEKDLSIDINLVLCANTKYEDLREIYKNFSSTLDIDTLIITKMDETRWFGNMFSLIYDIKKPISYFSTGQEVPDDLTVASSDFFIECLLEGFKVRENGK